MLLSLSWRNVWRNRTRSFVMIGSIVLGLCAGIFMTAFYQGMSDQRIAKAIQTEISHIQIHRPGFRQANEVTAIIPGADSLTHAIRQLPGVAGASNRLVIYSMIASAETGTGVKIIGADPNAEKKTSNLSGKIVEGDWFDQDRRNAVVLGAKLAEKLHVRLGSKVVITLQDIDNNITAGAFRIVGLFNTLNFNYDESTVFVRFNDLARLTNMPPGVGHEIAVLATADEGVPALKDKIVTMANGNEVLTWRELSPEMNYLTESMDLYMYIFIGIILVALLFGIINTMLMAVLDRTKELGMLMAVGMSRLRIFGMIVLESVLLSLSGGVLGVIFGTMIAKYFEQLRIDLSVWGDVYTSLGYDPYVYTHLRPELLINITVLVMITGLLAAFYPAYKALKNDPAEALRTE